MYLIVEIFLLLHKELSSVSYTIIISICVLLKIKQKTFNSACHGLINIIGIFMEVLLFT